MLLELLHMQMQYRLFYRLLNTVSRLVLRHLKPLIRNLSVGHIQQEKNCAKLYKVFKQNIEINNAILAELG